MQHVIGFVSLYRRPGNNSVPEWMQKQLRAGYYSAVT
eukprot:SAG31_NODE_43765_length_265_cov_1.427711_1_plen_36_part_10